MKSRSLTVSLLHLIIHNALEGKAKSREVVHISYKDGEDVVKGEAVFTFQISFPGQLGFGT